MKKIVALMRKEYMETRHISAVFLVLGLCSPFMPTFFPIHPEDVPGVIFLRFLFFAALHLATLCSISFVRERRNGTITILHRIVSDWRIVAFAKFGYAILSSFALALFFGTILGWADFRAGFPFGWIAVEFAESWRESPVSVSLSCSWLAYVTCWGVFWTGRLNRKFLVLALSFFTPMAVMLIAIWRCSLFQYEGEKAAIICNVVACLIAIVLAPFPQRFGYRQR